MRLHPGVLDKYPLLQLNIYLPGDCETQYLLTYFKSHCKDNSSHHVCFLVSGVVSSKPGNLFICILWYFIFLNKITILALIISSVTGNLNEKHGHQRHLESIFSDRSSSPKYPPCWHQQFWKPLFECVCTPGSMHIHRRHGFCGGCRAGNMYKSFSSGRSFTWEDRTVKLWN